MQSDFSGRKSSNRCPASFDLEIVSLITAGRHSNVTFSSVFITTATGSTASLLAKSSWASVNTIINQKVWEDLWPIEHSLCNNQSQSNVMITGFIKCFMGKKKCFGVLPSINERGDDKTFINTWVLHKTIEVDIFYTQTSIDLGSFVSKLQGMSTLAL